MFNLLTLFLEGNLIQSLFNNLDGESDNDSEDGNLGVNLLTSDLD